MEQKQKYLWYTDTHLDKLTPWAFISFIRSLNKQKPSGVFLTGDISNGIFTPFHLMVLAKTVKCPIYFILGNHDYHLTGLRKQSIKIKKLCRKYSNLIWLSQSDVIPLNEEVALIGHEGWYDAQIGNPSYLKYTLDWILIEEMKNLPTMEERLKYFKELSKNSCDSIAKKLQKAIDSGYKSIYILSHFPPWKEATRDQGTILENFWLPYNVNFSLGQTIEDIMKDHKKRYVTVLSGHTHQDAWIHVARNIECKVNRAKYYGDLRNEEHIFI